MQLTEEFIAYILDKIRGAPMETIIPFNQTAQIYGATVHAIKHIIDKRMDHHNGFELEIASCPAPAKHPDENAGKYTERYAAWWRESHIPGVHYGPSSFRKLPLSPAFTNNKKINEQLNEKYGREIFAIDKTINYLSSPNEENQQQESSMNAPETTSTTSPILLSAEVISASFSEGKKQIEALVGDLKSIQAIPDEATAAFAKNKMVELKNILGRIEEKRKEIKEPVLEAGRRIDTIAKDLASGGNTENERIKNLLFGYDQEQARLQRVREQAAEQERQRIATEAQQKISSLSGVQDLIHATERSIFALLNAAKTTADLKTVLTQHIKKEVFYTPAGKYAGMEEIAEAMRMRMNNFGKAKNKLLQANVDVAANVITSADHESIRLEYTACLANTEMEMHKASEQAQVVAEQKTEEIVMSREIQNSNVTSAVSMTAPKPMVGSRRSPWQFRVLNFDTLPDQFKKTVVNEEAVKAFIEAKKDALDQQAQQLGAQSVLLTPSNAIEFFFEVTPVMPRG